MFTTMAKKKPEDYIMGNCKSNYTILRLVLGYSENFRLNIERRTLIKGVSYRVRNGKQIYIATGYICKNSEKERNEI